MLKGKEKFITFDVRCCRLTRKLPRTVTSLVPCLFFILYPKRVRRLRKLQFHGGLSKLSFKYGSVHALWLHHGLKEPVSYLNRFAGWQLGPELIPSLNTIWLTSCPARTRHLVLKCCQLWSHPRYISLVSQSELSWRNIK